MENNELSSEQKIKIELKKLDRYAQYIGGAGIIFLFGFTIIATQFHIWFDFSNTGQIGDTIGGLTTPIIGIFSGLLIYLSFRAQIKANYIVQEQIDRQKKEEDEKREINYQMVIFTEIKESIRSFSYIDDKGSEAIKSYLIDSRKGLIEGRIYDFTKFFHLYSIISLFIETVKSLSESHSKKFDVRMTKQLIEGLFYREIWSYLDNEIQEYLTNETDKSVFYDLYNKISKVEHYFKVLRK